MPSPEVASARLFSSGPAWGPRRLALTLGGRENYWDSPHPGPLLGLSQWSLMFTCDPAGPTRRMELTGGDEGWSPASVIKTLPDLPLLYSHQTLQVRAYFPHLQRGERGSGEVNPKSQRWDSNWGLGDLTGPLLTYMDSCPPSLYQGPRYALHHRPHSLPCSAALCSEQPAHPSRAVLPHLVHKGPQASSLGSFPTNFTFYPSRIAFRYFLWDNARSPPHPLSLQNLTRVVHAASSTGSLHSAI